MSYPQYFTKYLQPIPTQSDSVYKTIISFVYLQSYRVNIKHFSHQIRHSIAYLTCNTLQKMEKKIDRVTHLNKKV